MYFYDPCSSGSNILKYERVKARDEGDNLERESLVRAKKWGERERINIGEKGEERNDPRLSKNADMKKKGGLGLNHLEGIKG